MCYQMSLYHCRHMDRERIPCRKAPPRRNYYCLSPLVDYLWPPYRCDHLPNPLQRVDRPCKSCRAKPVKNWPLQNTHSGRGGG